jgi:hypothetical protein
MCGVHVEKMKTGFNRQQNFYNKRLTFWWAEVAARLFAPQRKVVAFLSGGCF